MKEARTLDQIRAFVALVLALLVFAMPAQARAQNHIQAELLLIEAREDGHQTYAIHFQPEPGWHGYWSNPGDAGLGMQLEWSWPAEWFGAPQYPVPQRLTIAGLMNHVYESEYAVLIEARPSGDLAEDDIGPLEVRAQWLACTDKICVPEQAQLIARPALGLAKADQWRAAIAPLLDSKARFELGQGSLRLAIPIPAALEISDPHVFIANERLIDYAAPQGFYRKGDTLIAEIPLRGGATPDQVEGILSLDGERGVRFEADSGEIPTGGTPIRSGTENPALWVLLLGAIAGGLVLNIMPCVFPILSLKAISLARAGESQAQARREGLAYTAGVVLACVALGALMLALRAAGEQVGWAFQLQQPGVVVFLLLLATAITANLAGLFELPSISFTRQGEPASAFATGLLAAFVATPCTGPFMAAALGAALLLPTPEALLLFAALGLGLALPFLLIGLVPALRSKLPRPGAWMVRFRQVMAIPMGLTALALLWLAGGLGGQGFAVMAGVILIGLVVALWVAGRVQRQGKQALLPLTLIMVPFLAFGALALPSAYSEQEQRGAQSILKPVEFSEAALGEARASGRPVFLWFTADWCVTCKVNEGVAIEREATRQAFDQAGVVAMVGDWTRPDAEITAFLNAQGAAGVPLYLWYEPGGEAEQLPQVLTADMLIELARRDRKPPR